MDDLMDNLEDYRNIISASDRSLSSRQCEVCFQRTLVDAASPDVPG